MALVRTKVSGEHDVCIIRVKRIRGLGTTIAVTNMFTGSVFPSPLILFTLLMEAIRPPETLILTKPYGITSQKTAFFVVTAVKPQILCKLK
jgi:hypothetical protein